MTQGAAGEHSSAGVSTVFPLLARSPPPSRQPHPLGLSSLLPPAPPPPFQARPWPPNSRSSLRERAAARRFSRASGGGGSAPTFATQGLAAWAPTTGLRRARVSLPTRELGGAQCVCICLCLCLCPCRVVCVVCNSRTGHCSILALASRHRLSAPGALAPRGPPRPHARHTTEPGRRAFLLLYKTRTPTPAPVSGPSAIEKKDFGEPTQPRDKFSAPREPSRYSGAERELAVLSLAQRELAV